MIWVMTYISGAYDMKCTSPVLFSEQISGNEKSGFSKYSSGVYNAVISAGRIEFYLEKKSVLKWTREKA